MKPRRAVVLAGRREWCLAEAPDAPRVSGDAARLLGQEFDALVFDAFEGFDPDAFGAAVGTIRASGTLWLLAPPLGEWPGYEDPERARIAAWPYGRGRRRRPVVLTSDRGRGKSAALGITAGRLLAERPRRIVVTGPSKRAVGPVFRHAACVLGAEPSTLRYVPPGELLLSLDDADVVWVDEAATLPVPLLERLLRGHPRIAFATTVHGYEGTGRGFTVRFRGVLDAVAPRTVRQSRDAARCTRPPTDFGVAKPTDIFGYRYGFAP